MQKTSSNITVHKLQRYVSRNISWSINYSTLKGVQTLWHVMKTPRRSAMSYVPAHRNMNFVELLRRFKYTRSMAYIQQHFFRKSPNSRPRVHPSQPQKDTFHIHSSNLYDIQRFLTTKTSRSDMSYKVFGHSPYGYEHTVCDHLISTRTSRISCVGC